MRVPLYNRLRRQLHRDIAALQDEVVEVVYSLEENAVLHGGTAVWRCFRGNRFSGDLDFYFIPRKGFKDSFASGIAALGVDLVKYKATSNAVYSKIVRGNVVVAFEVLQKSFSKPVVREFEKVDGSFLDVFTLSAEELLLEKLAAFKGRRLVRDIYDVYHLSRFVDGGSVFRRRVLKLLNSIQRPVDEKNLKSLVLFGAVPSYSQMLQVLERRFLR